MLRRCSRSLTLLEMVLAVSFMAAAFLMLQLVFASSLRLSGQAERIALAHRHLQRVVESVMSTPFNDIAVNFPNRVYPIDPPLTRFAGDDRWVDLDGDAVFDPTVDLLLDLHYEDLWIQHQPIAHTGPLGAPGDEGNPLEVTVVAQWVEPTGETLTRALVTVVAN